MVVDDIWFFSIACGCKISLKSLLRPLVRDITQPLAIKTMCHLQPSSNLFFLSILHFFCTHSFIPYFIPSLIEGMGIWWSLLEITLTRNDGCNSMNHVLNATKYLMRSDADHALMKACATMSRFWFSRLKSDDSQMSARTCTMCTCIWLKMWNTW